MQISSKGAACNSRYAIWIPQSPPAAGEVLSRLSQRIKVASSKRLFWSLQCIIGLEKLFSRRKSNQNDSVPFTWPYRLGGPGPRDSKSIASILINSKIAPSLALNHLHHHHHRSRSFNQNHLDTMSSDSVNPSERTQVELNKGLDCWSVFSPASGLVPKDSLNLGQGFMNWGPPEFMKQAAKDALEDIPSNHYSVPKGRIRLRKALSDHYSNEFNLGRPLDHESEIIVTSGANFGIYSTMMAFCASGDEVILMEPFFDQYVRNVTFCDGKPVYVPLRPPPNASRQNVSSKEWKLNINDLKAAITPKTKIIILNTPHNPIGKVFDKEELQAIGEVAEQHNLLIIADEVYDCLTFDEPHTRIASLSPSLWNRTVTVGSAGKSFAATGWRLGWCIGPSELIRPITAVGTRTTFCSVGPLQEAVATGFELANEKKFFEIQRDQYKARRDLLLGYLDLLGLPYTVPDGSYFVLVESTRIEIPEDFEIIDLVKPRPRDWHMCWFIAKVAGVVCIPPSDFYSPEHLSIGQNFVRIAFCKDIKTLKEAGEKLQNLKPFIKM
ncbi:hypothetical protein O181_010500 [Austropuccinia psidii MF-1]|uniref:Aminotransferase class I/classII large domain-containing protein n=1 Tax=Austropuccinia psidii MF-1 TaxID=1389203 RepID=A0A9Q3GKY8_9BASI|nr:hypothetical protein [Austropuccinia psidii MF-1]